MGNIKTYLSKISAFASTICMVHCLLTPILIPFVSFSSLSFFVTEQMEFLLSTIAFTSAFITLLLGFYKYHSKIMPFYYVGLALILKGSESIVPHHYEILIDLSIGVFIIVALIVNQRLCKSCPDCSHHH